MMQAMRNRWLIVVASAVGLLAGNGPVMQFTFGTFLPPIVREFGWSRGLVSTALVAGIWMTGIATPFFGRLVDRYGIRAVALPAITVFSVATASVALVPASPAAFVALYALMGLSAAGQTPLIYSKAISARFDHQRGLALGIAISGVGLGATLVPQYVHGWIEAVGWRAAYAALGALTFALAFPAVAWFVGVPEPHRPSATRRESTLDQSGFTGLEALRTTRFWSLAFSFFIVSGTTGGVISHLVPLMADRGVSARAATAVLSIAGTAMIAGRVFSGFVLDRVHARYVAAACFLMPLAGIIVLLSGSGQEYASAGVLLIGLGLGAEMDLMAFLASRYFGIRSFGEIYGYFLSIFLLGSGLGPFSMGASYDHTGSYSLMLGCFVCALVFAMLPVLRLGPYVYPTAHAIRLRSAALASES
jgi:MFS family permease